MERVSISMNCMQNLGKQVDQIFKMLKKTEDRQIKTDCQPTDLIKSVDFMTQKFDEYEKNQREKDAIIATSQSDLKTVSMKVEYFEKKMDRQEQHSRKNCVLIHRSKQNKNERNEHRVLELFGEEINEDVLSVHLDRTHKLDNRETQTASRVQLL